MPMKPIDYFNSVWARADLFAALHGYMSSGTTAALNPDELLRAEWVMRVSALDLYVHELIAEKLLEIFNGVRPVCPGFQKLQISSQTMLTLISHTSGRAGGAVFDLEIRDKLSRVTYQYPDDIADGIRLVSPIELWNTVAAHQGAVGGAIKTEAANLKISLKQIVGRRNKIVHEGDLQPGVPRNEWPIARADLIIVRSVIETTVRSIDAVI
mgnify:CR=1 FL=1|jgi:hypothetical protein